MSLTVSLAPNPRTVTVIAVPGGPPVGVRDTDGARVKESRGDPLPVPPTRISVWLPPTISGTVRLFVNAPLEDAVTVVNGVVDVESR